MPEFLSYGNPFPQHLNLRREMAEIQSKYHRIIVENKDWVHNNLLFQENYLRVVFNQSAKRIKSWTPLPIGTRYISEAWAEEMIILTGSTVKNWKYLEDIVRIGNQFVIDKQKAGEKIKITMQMILHFSLTCNRFLDIDILDYETGRCN